MTNSPRIYKSTPTMQNQNKDTHTLYTSWYILGLQSNCSVVFALGMPAASLDI
jgi:hypothetical protein